MICIMSMSPEVRAEIAKLSASIRGANTVARGMLGDFQNRKNLQPTKPYGVMTIEELIAAQPTITSDNTHK